MRSAILVLVATGTIAAYPQVSTGGDFTLEKVVVSGGGGASSDPSNVLKVTGTIGQSAAGGAKTNLPFTSHAGFWTPELLAPTAASVRISGRLVTSSGRPIGNTYITLTAPNGSVRTARSSTFGYFRFDDVEAGDTYVLDVSSRRYVFANTPMILSVTDEVSDLKIVGALR